MKSLLFVTALLVTFSITTSAQTSVSAYASTKGIGPIPAFLLPERASSVFVSVPVGKHVTIDPDYAFSLKTGEP